MANREKIDLMKQFVTYLIDIRVETNIMIGCDIAQTRR